MFNTTEIRDKRNDGLIEKDETCLLYIEQQQKKERK
jgi:hypothetical protein